MNDITIYYADDDMDDLQLFKSAVEKTNENISLQTYHKGDDFLSAIKSNEKDRSIIFLDINMPGKNGFEILKELRKDEVLSKTPVIMYSTSSDEHTINTSKDTGATMYAVKPVSFADLKDMIRKAVATNWDLFRSPPQSFLLNAS